MYCEVFLSHTPGTGQVRLEIDGAYYLVSFVEGRPVRAYRYVPERIIHDMRTGERYPAGDILSMEEVDEIPELAVEAFERYLSST